ncbi:MAG: hypothetical protein M3Q55_11740, partial [Acidobacteriota bacterium]|nr:hypothetical protein [Acidobacteriota bacterium]
MPIRFTANLAKARKLHRRRIFAGMRVSVESQRGSYRRWGDPHSAEHGKTLMKFDYGYLRGSLGTDGDHVDVYLGPNELATHVYIVDQACKVRGSRAGDGLPWPKFDEQKVMLGFDSMADARAAYLAHYDDPRFLMGIREMPLGEFRAKVVDKAHHGYVLKSGGGSHKYTSKKPDGHGGWDYTYPDDHVGPRAHSMHLSGKIFGGEDRSEAVHVTHLGDGTVRVSQHDDAKYGPVMPASSLKHFLNDLRGHVDLPESKNKAINAVVTGKARLLGKGDDGIAFHVGDQVVKVSTTVPFQPFNQGHRSPEDAVSMLRGQVEVGNTLADAGVPGIQRSEFVQHGDKGFQIKPFVEIPDKLTKEHLDAAHASILEMHAKGYALNDDVQVGIEGDRAVLFDIGKAAAGASENQKRADLDNLAYLYKKNGETPPASAKRRDAVWDVMVHNRAVKLAATDEMAAIKHLDQSAEHRSAWIKTNVSDEAKQKSMLRDINASYRETETAIYAAADAAAKTKKSEPRYVLSKGAHKYIEKHPDGRGGWDYTYAARGPHADAQAHLTPHARKPGAKGCSQCKGRGKV